MASAKVTLGTSPSAATERVDMVIIGGGICGILAAKSCVDRGLSYAVVERTAGLGGVWHTMANATSFLQAFEPNYRFDESYRLNDDPLTKNTSQDVLTKLRQYAADYGIPEHTLFCHEAVTVLAEKGGAYRVVARDLSADASPGSARTSTVEKHIVCDYLCVTCGILSTQWTPADRGVKDVEKFKGIVTLGGRHEGQDSAVARNNLTGKRVVVMGSGSFAAEALEAAERAGAEHITVVGRPRYRWILPFSRQYTISAIAQAPLIPWSLKTQISLRYLRDRFYKPCGLAHWAPQSYKPSEMDFSGQCNDGYFRLAAAGKLTAVLGAVDRMDATGVVLKSGERLPCDIFVCASGCKYNLEPPFLKAIGIGFKDMHNFAFLGANPRIGCASDFVFAYVPFGPIKQLEMFFHSVDCCRRGLEDQVRAALRPTPLPNHGEGMHKGGRMAGHYTFFEHSHWWSVLSKAQEARVESMFSVLDVGRGPLARAGIRIAALLGNWAGWIRTCGRAVKELWRYPVFGPGVGDHHYTPQHLALHTIVWCPPVVDTVRPTKATVAAVEGRKTK